MEVEKEFWKLERERNKILLTRSRLIEAIQMREVQGESSRFTTYIYPRNHTQFQHRRWQQVNRRDEKGPIDIVVNELGLRMGAEGDG
ncbi:uncharacterized protein G2W53_003613 [Senna tora]|uniref:Uncharacterized protein n=1 Tax=Senna tora TaxID=362788 RepID=A0A834XAH2_9FABA|nr:uncharacterized protein G2W53_003613 [Senna tora]